MIAQLNVDELASDIVKTINNTGLKPHVLIISCVLENDSDFEILAKTHPEMVVSSNFMQKVGFIKDIQWVIKIHRPVSFDKIPPELFNIPIRPE